MYLMLDTLFRVSLEKPIKVFSQWMVRWDLNFPLLPYRDL